MPEEFGEHLIRDQRPFSSSRISPDPSDSQLLLFSSPHSFSVGFRSEDRDSNGKRFILCSVTHFCVYFDVWFGLLSWWKIQTRSIIRFLTEAVRFRFFICWYLIESMMPCIWTRCSGPGGITWPIDGDAGLVFRSAHFATYFKILSVKFEPLCIRPIMSTKAEKGDRKREIEQSPMKKKFRDSAISSEDLDNAIANRIEVAFKEHQSTLNSVVNSAVRDAMDSVLIPALRELREDIQATNKSVKELREEFEAIVTRRSRHVTALILFRQQRAKINEQLRI